MEPREPEYLRDLVRKLCALPAESEWVEFKRSNSNPETIGENISALANSAVLNDRESAYIAWGISDVTHDIVGTNFTPDGAKKGNEPLTLWLRKSVSDNTDFLFHSTQIDGRSLVVLEIAPATQFPTKFKRGVYVRVGPATKKLSDEPQIERRLWRLLDRRSFEDGIVAANLTSTEVLAMLDYPAYFHLLGLPMPDGNANILDSMRRDGLLKRSDAGGWDITNLAAILLARDLGEFTGLGRKRLRVIRYDGSGRFHAARERQFDLGYAAAFQQVIEHIMALVPSNEVIEQALNVETPMFPEVAVRELVANALIHQDFFVTGSGPLVEIFADRIEVTNPGEPLVETLRFLDAPPKSRNESTAALMRRFGICEERGSGIDKVVNLIEAHQLPAPLFEVVNAATRCVLFAHKNLSDMGPDERVRACYWHSCLRYVTNQLTNNRSVRERFDIPENRTPRASKLLKEAIDAQLIVVRDPEAGTRNRSYIPWWAGQVTQT